MTASVGGITFNYTFDWYNGAVATGGIDFSGIDYFSRDVGPYSVTATDQVTGCISPAATVTVLDKRVMPEFTFTTTPSYCSDTGKPKGAGSIQLNLPDGMLFERFVQNTLSIITSPPLVRLSWIDPAPFGLPVSGYLELNR